MFVIGRSRPPASISGRPALFRLASLLGEIGRAVLLIHHFEGVPMKKKKGRLCCAQPAFVPDLIDILAGCQAIQKTWSESDERRHRLGTSAEPVPYQIPTVPTPRDDRELPLT